MLEQLTERQRTFEVMAGMRRPSVWHNASQGSIGSDGSIGRSAASSISTQHNPSFGNISAPAVQPVQYASTASPPQLSPPLHHQAQLWQHSGSMPTLYRPTSHSSTGNPAMHHFNSADAVPQFRVEAPNTFPTLNAAPHQQFGAWGGYTAPHAPDTLDEENAIPPGATWDQYQH